MIPLAVIKIKALNVIGRMYELDTVTEVLGGSGVFHPDNALSFYSDTSGFSPLNETSPYSGALGSIRGSARQIHRETELERLRHRRVQNCPVQDWKSAVKQFADSVSGFIDQRQQTEKQIQTYGMQIGRISHFAGLDLDLTELRECRFIKIRFGSIPEDSYEKLSDYSGNPFVAFFPSSREAGRYWGMYCAPIEMLDSVDRIFESLYFEGTSLSDFSGSIESTLENLRALQKKEQSRLDEIDSQISAYWEKKKTGICAVYSYLSERAVYFGIRRHAARYGDNFILTGWIPADRENFLKERLDRLETVKYTFDDAADPEVLAHSPPVKLRNKQIFSPFEFFVDIYGIPSYTEMDPTVFVAITYFLIFGIMFSDLGQGFVLALTGWLLWKKKKSALGRVMVPCGISSAIFGTLFGSVFGFEHALDPMYKGIFGLPRKPISVMDSTTQVVYFAVLLGVFLVIAAILTNIVSCLKRKQYTNGIFGPNGIAGLVFYTSVVFGLIAQIALDRKVITTPYVICFFCLPLLSMLFREVLGGLVEGRPDWKPESWGGYIMENFFEVFEFLLSFLTNTISFIRVGAFVLVHAGMMLVVFTLANMTSGALLGIPYFLIVLGGNAFVIALEGLLSGVQTLRLEFYEMFSRFYDGSGRPFTPVVVGQEA